MATDTTVPFTDEDRAWARERERSIVRDALLSDSELEAYRDSTERALIGQRLRGSPPWWIELTEIRREVIAAEIKARRYIASRGGPGYAPDHWWHDLVDTLRQRAVADLTRIMAEGGFVPDPRHRRADDLWGRCPLHTEQTSSFHVDTETGLWHCFGCGDGGDVYALVEKMHGLSFPEAVRWLAQRYGIPIEAPRLKPVWEAYES